MKLNHLFIVLLAGSAILAGCRKDEPKEETKKDALITFTAKYGETIEGVAKPEKAVLTIDNAKVDVVDGKFNAEILGETETHLVAAYNEVAGVTMDNGVLSLGAEGAQLPSADWMFAYAENKKLTKASTSLSVTLKQQTKQINVIVRSLGGKSNNISEATAELTGVAAQKDILNNVYKAPASASAKLPEGNRPGSFYGLVRVLGFIPNSESALKLNFTYTDGTTSTTTVDISANAEQFNEDKTVIEVISVSIVNLGTAEETFSSEITSNGTLENIDNSSSAPAGDKKITINWPSYNTADNVEILAGGLSYFGALGEATEAGQTTTNGFASLPAADQIEEIAIYLGTERLLAPAGYFEYADGVVTMTDCKLVYKSEHLSDEYITADGTFVQTVDLAVPTGFKPLHAADTSKFTGTYDGYGHAITGLNTTEPADYTGVFAKNYGTVKNLTVKESRIVAGGFTGSIAGRNYKDIINCESSAEIVFTAKKNFVGGITGHSEGGVISGCKFSGSIIDKELKSSWIGGITGGIYFNGVIENCLNTGYIETSAGGCGGIVGRNQGNVYACKNTADLVLKNGAQTAGNGGVIGIMNHATGHEDCGNAYACVNTGNITGTQYFGGVVGVLSQTKDQAGCNLVACYNTGILIDGAGAGLVGKAAGWLAGRNQQGYIKYCYTVSEGQPKTSNGVFGNGNIDLVDVQKFDGTTPAWPDADNTKSWGVWTEGCTVTDGYYWKSLGSATEKAYPKLYWEE